MMRHLGFDPGITGAVAVVGDGPAAVYDLPVRVRSRGTVKHEIDAAALVALLGVLRDRNRGAPIRAMIELTSSMPGQGVSSMFSMGVSRGIILGVLGGLGIVCAEVAPAVWKRHFDLLGNDKSHSRALASRYYPELGPRLERIRDHNRAEALLIARYSERRYEL